MFAGEFISNHIFEILGLLVTIAGVWFVVQQLREAKLASQMEGMIHLAELSGSNETREELRELVYIEEWEILSPKEAYSRIFDSENSKKGFLKMASVYELVGVFVKRKALDEGIVYDQYGHGVPFWWRRLEKVIVFMRRVEKNEALFVNWEWLAQRFEKRNK